MAVRSSTTGKLKDTMLALLPADGTPVLNRVMRLMLARRLERPVDEDDFFETRDALLSAGKVGRLRGQGGQIFLVKPDAAALSAAESSDKGWSERRLMPPLKAFLEGPFRKGLDLADTGAVVIQDTSAVGPSRGRWARPDFILVSAMRFKLLPGCEVDLHAFELKTEAGGGVLAIHEALAQTRFTHFGHLVWHLPDGSRSEPMLDDIVMHCDEHGIGLIRMRDPLKAASNGCEILVDPRRKPTLNAIVDGFLESRLTPEQKQILLNVTGGSA
ncbi:hypothetical protein LGH83_11615 [Lichenihabitans sp. PAMC28606]|uniref:hypothetical protein n=1 Tax=Lichenihabitans sp. PAMC28606 TaxID=2880932 RepID=UPI001D0B829F|nr:hypothetical protein [Lichenihabitans sp. PAMC28606]UDL93250.1 hypothetical protein LGH83_11615 [Lichenihabitans sp. PAMC28606]